MSGGLRVAVLGLEYVGLPLAAGLARKDAVSGFDNCPNRITEIHDGLDRTGEVRAAARSAYPIKLASTLVGGPLEADVRHDTSTGPSLV